MKRKNVSLVLETAEIEKKIGRLARLPQAPFSRSVTRKILRELPNMIVFHDLPALRTGRTNKIRVRLDFDARFENLVAAIRAGELEAHC